jgi:ISXO2-like transposase domain
VLAVGYVEAHSLAGRRPVQQYRKHGAGQRRRIPVKDTIESVFAVLKRGITGVYHHTSRKHLGRYVDEFAFRLNDGNVKRHTIARLDSFIKATARKRLTYARLIA